VGGGPFDDWYESAGVRQGLRRMLVDETDQGRVYFPASLVPYLDHELVTARGAAVRQALTTGPACRAAPGCAWTPSRCTATRAITRSTASTWPTRSPPPPGYRFRTGISVDSPRAWTPPRKSFCRASGCWPNYCRRWSSKRLSPPYLTNYRPIPR